MPATISAETATLISACHVGVDPPSRPPGPLDVEALVRLARFHRVVALAHENRARLQLPAEAVDPLRAAAMAVLHRNLQFAAELKLALKALDAASIPVILLKGAHLMDAAYANLAQRPISDLDVLVRPEDGGRSIAALREAGYHADPKEAAFGLAADREARLDKTGVHTVVIELHTDLNRPTRHHWFDMDAIWERSVEYPFDGVPARALGWADNLVFLCAHAVPHAFAQLIWLRDIAGVGSPASRGGDWPAVVAAARDARAVRASWAGLSLARGLMGADVPEAALEELAGIVVPPPAELLTPARLFGDTHYSTLDSLRWRAALADSRADGRSIIGASLSRKAGELRRGIVKKKQRGAVDR